MFTGLVEGTCQVVQFQSRDGATRLVIDAGPIADGAQIGDSIAINGCCLTVTTIDGPRLAFDLLEETRLRTNLGDLAPPSLVNLERALPANGRYGGHFVTGHIDTTGTVRQWARAGKDDELHIVIEPADGIYLVPKGSIAIDGISLTVGEVKPDEFLVWIIPHTRAITALRERIVGQRVNLEFDLLAKYTEKILAMRGFGAK
ncbi:MAG: riboflavin synthase [Methylacidiphilales bacterium]|nr:riboflavin synthase [Candidatus Methylacidiphilales bacterium]